MTLSTATKLKIVRALDDLPPESLSAVAEFVEFLRVKVAKSSPAPHPARRAVKLGGLWQGYSFSEDEIRAARREVWAALGRGVDAWLRHRRARFRCGMPGTGSSRLTTWKPAGSGLRGAMPQPVYNRLPRFQPEISNLRR